MHRGSTTSNRPRQLPFALALPVCVALLSACSSEAATKQQVGIVSGVAAGGYATVKLPGGSYVAIGTQTRIQDSTGEWQSGLPACVAVGHKLLLGTVAWTGHGLHGVVVAWASCRVPT
ncbi:MAG: hypothetical protein QOD07_1230 [Frankiaceae bacterium]|jgi:hypothetical protein|nr:hypothetical protein [Frankiaceae bacterium]